MQTSHEGQQTSRRELLMARCRHLATHGATEELRGMGQHAMAVLEPTRSTGVGEDAPAWGRAIVPFATWDERLLALHVGAFFGLACSDATNAQRPVVEFRGERRLLAIAQRLFEILKGAFHERVEYCAWFTAMKVLPLHEPTERN